MGHLATTTGAQTVTTSETPWSAPSLPQKLQDLLETPGNILDLPAVGPVSANALREYLAAPPPPLPERGHVNKMLGELSIALPKAQSSDTEAAARLEIYWKTLRTIPLHDLRFAYQKLIRESRFFPSVADIIAAAAPSRNRRDWLWSRAKFLVLKHEREWRPEPEPLTDEQRNEVTEMVGQVLALNPTHR
jgi:hypothetical protein